MDSEILVLLLQLAFPGALMFIFLTAFIIADKTFPDNILRLTMLALISGFIVIVTDSVNYYFEEKHLFTTLRLFALACSFTFKISCSCFCVALSQRKSKKVRLFLYLLIAANTIVSFVSIPTGCVFHINPDYSLGHGTLYFMPYMFILASCTVLMISGIRNYKKNRGETIICFSMVVFPFIATYLEVKFKFKLMIPLSFIICIIFYFMCLNVQLYRRDTLTCLLNRRSFFMDAKRFSKKKMIILSLDLNNLKYYNDTFGHSAGDMAITTASHTMELAFSHIGIVYRTGGDEFMVLFVNKHEESIKDAIETFTLLLAKTRYQVAYGYSVYTPGDDFETIVAQSDAKMYRTKMEMKKAKAMGEIEKNPDLSFEPLELL